MKSLINFKEKGIGGEILRFVLTGGIATVIDYVVGSLIASLLPDSLGFWKTAIYTTCGFAVSLVANYLLSAFWVYKNVDKNVDKKSAKNIALFVGLSAIGLLIGIGINAGFEALDNCVIHCDFENWLDFITKGSDFKFRPFIWSLLFFGTKTLIVLIWNYISRKKFIFKSPEDESLNN